MNEAESVKDVVTEAVKSAPPVGIVGLTVFGYEVSDIIQLLTLVYLVLQIGWLVRKFWKGRKNGTE